MIQLATSTAPIRPLEILPSSTGQGDALASQFADVLQNAIGRVEGSGASAGRAVAEFLAGGGQDLHSVALASQKASLEFEMLLQVRNKIVQAYQEVMRMQL